MKTTVNNTGTPCRPKGQLLHELFSPFELQFLGSIREQVGQAERQDCRALPPRLEQELVTLGLRKLRLYTEWMSRASRLARDPQLQRFLRRPLAEHGLPTRLYHLLTEKDCQTMQDVLELGMVGVRSMRGVGKGSLQALQQLLEQHGAAGLW